MPIASTLSPRGTSYQPELDAYSFPCGCIPVLHRYRCAGCRRWVGWCMGCDDATPELCDDCAMADQEAEQIQ